MHMSFACGASHVEKKKCSPTFAGGSGVFVGYRNEPSLAYASLRLGTARICVTRKSMSPARLAELAAHVKAVKRLGVLWTR